MKLRGKNGPETAIKLPRVAQLYVDIFTQLINYSTLKRRLPSFTPSPFQNSQEENLLNPFSSQNRRRKMTNYGTIPTSSSGPVNMEYISRAKEVIKEGLGTRRPWKEMCNLHSIKLPSGVSDAISRIKTNLSYFQMNYAIVVLGIVFLSLLWHPISLIVFVVLMAVWLFLYFLRDEPLVIFNRLISDRVVLIVLSVLTLGLLLFTGATSNILISLAVGVFVVLIHASIRTTDDLCMDEESAGFLSRGSAPSS